MASNPVLKPAHGRSDDTVAPYFLTYNPEDHTGGKISAYTR